MTFRTTPVRVRVPATSANLGPGFDALGLALGLHDEVSAAVTDGGLSIDVDGEGAGLVAQDETHLVVQAMRATFAELGAQPPGVRLTCHNRIPHGRGLGSSAAAIVAGVLLAQALVDGVVLPEQRTLALAAEIEGHPDNVAACILGGLTIAWTGSEGPSRALRLDPVGVIPVVFIPNGQSSTKQARQALPAVVPHADAAFNAGRSALLVAALTAGDGDALWDATQDRLHQGYRAPGMPDSTGLLDVLRGNGLPGVISGAGPTVLVLARSQREVESALGFTPPGWRSETPGIDLPGASLISG
jgi:homoserine kinase